MTRLLLPCLLALAAACAQIATPGSGALIYNFGYDAAYAESGPLALGGERPLELHGTPPAGLAPQEFADLIRVPGFYQKTRLVVSPPGRAGGALRFVLATGTDHNISLCERPRAGGDPRLVAIAVCTGRNQISRAAARLALDRPLAPQLALMMRALLTVPRPSGPDRCRRLRGC